MDSSQFFLTCVICDITKKSECIWIRILYFGNSLASQIAQCFKVNLKVSFNFQKYEFSLSQKSILQLIYIFTFFGLKIQVRQFCWFSNTVVNDEEGYNKSMANFKVFLEIFWPWRRLLQTSVETIKCWKLISIWWGYA